MNYIITPASTAEFTREASRDSIVSSYEYDEEFEMLVTAFLRDMDYTTVNQTALNIIYSMINAGLIALPYAASQGGLGLYTLIILTVGLLSAYTSIIVISMANEQKVRTLEDLAECAFGPRGFFAVSFFQMLFSFALICITLDVYADIMVDVFRPSPYRQWILRTRIGQLILGSIFVLPLCLMKTSMSNIKWTSYVTVCAMMAALIAVIATYLSDNNTAHSILSSQDKLMDVLSPKDNWWFTLFLAIFSFSCNQKVMTVFSSLRQRSVSRWQTAVKRAYGLLLVIYLFFGNFGYISVQRMDMDMNNVNFFVGSDGEEVKAIYDPARVTVAISLLLTIPVDCLVAVTTYRRFYSKYMKIYHCNVPAASPLYTFIDKCLVRLSLVSVQTPSQMGTMDEEAGSRQSSTAVVPAMCSPRFNRRSKALHFNSRAGSRTVSQAMDEQQAESESERATEDSRAPSTEVDESGWSVYSALLAGNAKTHAAQYEERKSPVQGDEALARRIPTNSTVQDSPIAADETPEMLENSFNFDLEHITLKQHVTHVSPSLALFALCFLTCLGVPHWLYLAASICTLSTAILLFIFPSILYFRLGLISDYQSIPLVYNILPNQIYMYIIQVTGMLFIVFDMILLFYFIIRGEHFVQDSS